MIMFVINTLGHVGTDVDSILIIVNITFYHEYQLWVFEKLKQLPN